MRTRPARTLRFLAVSWAPPRVVSVVLVCGFLTACAGGVYGDFPSPPTPVITASPSAEAENGILAEIPVSGSPCFLAEAGDSVWVTALRRERARGDRPGDERGGLHAGHAGRALRHARAGRHPVDRDAEQQHDRPVRPRPEGGHRPDPGPRRGVRPHLDALRRVGDRGPGRPGGGARSRLRRDRRPGRRGRSARRDRVRPRAALGRRARGARADRPQDAHGRRHDRAGVLRAPGARGRTATSSGCRARSSRASCGSTSAR